MVALTLPSLWCENLPPREGEVELSCTGHYGRLTIPSLQETALRELGKLASDDSGEAELDSQYTLGLTHALPVTAPDDG